MRQALKLTTCAAAAALALCASRSLAVDPGVPTTGPDVTINLLDTIDHYGASGGIHGYAVGTTSCNIGDTPVNWCDDGGGCGGILDPNQHPVIAQALYRLHAGRLVQIGMSWLKHGFLSTNTTEGSCKIGAGCTPPPLGSSQLGVGCRDTYDAGLNGNRPLGARSEVNGTTGAYPFPYTNEPFTEVFEQRVKVLESDIVGGAAYWVEGQYVADNDALAGNGLNNASYRAATLGGGFSFTPSGSIVRERSAIHAWAAADATVSIHNVDVPGALVERFEVARKVTSLGGGNWHYEFAIRNMNSDRSGQSFVVDFADGTTISNVGFRDIEHHSGEPYATTDWVPTVNGGAGSVTWATETFGTNANANALRWATMFNFWFDANVAPGGELHTLGLFKPGTPTGVSWQWPLFADGFEAHNFVAWSEKSP